MTVLGLRVAPGVAERLGDVLPELIGGLFAGACQACGREQPPPTDLVVDQPSGEFALATLHHHACRPSAWHDSGIAAWPREPYLTYSMGGAVIRFVEDGADDVGPVMSAAIVLLNPALEQHVLRRVDGRWVSCGLDFFEAAGLLPPTETDAGTAVAPHVRARVTTKTIFLDIEPPSAALRTFNGPVGEEVCRAALQAGRLLLIATQAVNPIVGHGPVELNTVLTDARARMGWVSVAG